MLVSLYHTGPQLVILLGACLVTGTFAPDAVGLLAALLAFGIVILLGTGMGLMFAAINVMYRDWTRVVQIFTQMLPFSVPMMYPYTLVRTSGSRASRSSSTSTSSTRSPRPCC